MSTHRTAKVLSGLLLCLASSYGFSQNEGRWYNVEVLVFKRLGSEAFNRENWRNDIDLVYPTKYQYIQPQIKQAPPKESQKEIKQQPSAEENFTLIAEDEKRLEAYKVALGKNESYQPLFHQAWKQQMQNAENSPALIIGGGDNIGNTRELSGYIKIHISRYLHLTSDLWLITENEPDAFNSANNSLSTAVEAESIWPTMPAPPGTRKQTSNTGDAAARNNAANPATIGTNENLPPWELSYLKAFNSYPVATLRDRRRMRSNELHYVDHPLMGVLILITPIEERNNKES